MIEKTIAAHPHIRFMGLKSNEMNNWEQASYSQRPKVKKKKIITYFIHFNKNIWGLHEDVLKQLEKHLGQKHALTLLSFPVLTFQKNL